MLRILLVIFVIINCKVAKTGGDTKFVTLLHHGDYKRFVNGENILIKRVHEDHWNIFYKVDDSCPASRKTTNTYLTLREHVDQAIKSWLAPLRKIANKPIVNKLIFHRDKIQRTYFDISVIFKCEEGISTSKIINRIITMRESTRKDGRITPDLPYRTKVLLHELGHAFDLADTYISKRGGFDEPSHGGPAYTIGNQPQSVMSSRGCLIEGKDVLCLDDKQAIQWLYHYHYSGLELTDCPPGFVFEELTRNNTTVGGCVYKQPMIIEARQNHLGGLLRLFNDDSKNIKINDQDKQGLTALHYVATFSSEDTVDALDKFLKFPGIDVNIVDNHGNSPLHWAAWFGNKEMVRKLVYFRPSGRSGLDQEKTQLNVQNIYGETALHYAAKSGRERCTGYLLRRANNIEVNIKDNRFGNTPLHEAAKNGHTEVVEMLLAYKDINRNIRNRAGKTARQLAVDKGYPETAKAFD